MKAWLSGIFAFRVCVILAGVAWMGLCAPAVRAEKVAAEHSVQPLVAEAEARHAVRDQVARRVGNFLAGDESFYESRLETAISGMARLGFSEKDISSVAKTAGFSAESCEITAKNARAARVAKKSPPRQADNSFLLAALESLNEGPDENVCRALDFARGNFEQKSEAAVLAQAALVGVENRTVLEAVIRGWESFESRLAAVIIAPEFPVEDMPREVPAVPVAELMAAVSGNGGGRVSQEKSAEILLTWAAPVVTPENKRFFEVQSASNTPLAGYFLIAQTNIRRE